MRIHRAAVVLALLGIGACGGSSSNQASTPAPAPTSTGSASGGGGYGSGASSSAGGSGASGAGALTVKETEFALNPADTTVSARNGSVTITAVNDGAVPHALSLEKAGPGGKDLETSVLQPGQSAKLTAKLKPGTYEWYCPVDGHKAKGMVGKLTVR